MKDCRGWRLPAQPRARRERLVWARRLNRNFPSGNVDQSEDGAQANNLACTCVEQQQLLAARHVRGRVDRTRPRRAITRHSDPPAQPRYSLRQSVSNMRDK